VSQILRALYDQESKPILEAMETVFGGLDGIDKNRTQPGLVATHVMDAISEVKFSEILIHRRCANVWYRYTTFKSKPCPAKCKIPVNEFEPLDDCPGCGGTGLVDATEADLEGARRNKVIDQFFNRYICGKIYPVFMKKYGLSRDYVKAISAALTRAATGVTVESLTIGKGRTLSDFDNDVIKHFPELTENAKIFIDKIIDNFEE